MTVWISGLLALVGALAGVLLSNYLSRSTRRSEAKRARLEDALRAVARCMATDNFATQLGFVGKPDSITDDDLRDFQRAAYVAHLNQLLTTLKEARQAAAVLVIDGVDVGDSWRKDETMLPDLPRLYDLLLNRLKLD